MSTVSSKELSALFWLPSLLVTAVPLLIAQAIPPASAGTAHIILAVTDDGSPRLTSYRRIILNVTSAVNQR